MIISQLSCALIIFLAFKAHSNCDPSIAGCDSYLVFGKNNFVATLNEQRNLAVISLNLFTNFAIQTKNLKMKTTCNLLQMLKQHDWIMQTQDAKSSQNLIEFPQTFHFQRSLVTYPPYQILHPQVIMLQFYSNLKIKFTLSNHFDVIIIIIIIINTDTNLSFSR